MDESRIRAARQAANRHPADDEPKHEIEIESEKPKEREHREVLQHSNRRREIDSESPLKRFFAPLVVLVVLVLAGVGGWLVWSNLSGGTGIDGSKYQAVFFTNGQVYFGKLHTMNNDYMRLTDIFYLQKKQSDTSSKNLQTGNNESDLSNVELIKLGQELHGPQDEMIISKDQILFYENLKADGKVSSTIATYKP